VWSKRDVEGMKRSWGASPYARVAHMLEILEGSEVTVTSPRDSWRAAWRCT
jgi:hypothetical protein